MSIDTMKQSLEALQHCLHYAQTHLQHFDAAYNRHPSTENERGVITDDIEDTFAAITALRTAIEQSSPLPTPPECKTEAEKIAYAFGWYKALGKHSRYYTIITTGEDDNLEIVGLYVSDHPVDPTEWRTSFKKFNQDLQDEHETIYQRHGGKLGYGHIPKAHDEYIAFMHKTHPLKPFIEKHGMKQLMFTELWTWGQP